MTWSAEPQGPGERFVRPAADVYRLADRVGIVVDVPGVRREGIRLTVEGKDLLLEAEAAELPGATYREPLLPRRYRRLFALPEHADPEGIRARLRDGVLEVTVPIEAPAASRSIPVEEG
ncbi:MAG TPA: Hsp20/alpha crystallin family protein [Longimicrobiales bacterium]